MDFLATPYLFVINFIMGEALFSHGGYSVRPWRCADRESAANVVRQCLEAYGLSFEPEGADLDALDVENHYQRDNRGEFWVVTADGTNEVIGTAGYYEVEDKNGEDSKCVEVRKMYLLPEARGKKLGRTILQVNLALRFSTPPLPPCSLLISLALSLSLSLSLSAASGGGDCKQGVSQDHRGNGHCSTRGLSAVRVCRLLPLGRCGDRQV